MKNILLGGEGMIGKALHAKLLQCGEECYVYDLKSGFDLRYMRPRCKPSQGAYCWFLAWDVGGAKYIMDNSTQMAILQHNLRLCSSVFSWLEETSLPFTFASTQMAGFPNAYGLTKAIGEFWTGSLGGYIARLWNVYGAEEVSQRSHVIPDMVRQGRQGSIRLLTDGSEQRQFLYAEDCAEALILQRKNGQKLADITSGRWVSIREIADIIGSLMGATVIPAEQPGYESLTEPKNQLSKWSPRIDLWDGIRKVIESSSGPTRS